MAQRRRELTLLDLPDDIFFHQMFGEGRNRGYITRVRDMQAVSRTCREFHAVALAWANIYGSDAHKLYLGARCDRDVVMPMYMGLTSNHGHSRIDVLVRRRGCRDVHPLASYGFDIGCDSTDTDTEGCILNATMESPGADLPPEIVTFPRLVRCWAHAILAEFFTKDGHAMVKSGRYNTLHRYFTHWKGDSRWIQWSRIDLSRNLMEGGMASQWSTQNNCKMSITIDYFYNSANRPLCVLSIPCAADWADLLYKLEHPALDASVVIEYQLTE